VSTSSTESSSQLNQAVRSYWESSPCGVSSKVVGDVTERSRDWFERIERARYEKEPFVPAVAQFSSAQGKKLLEIGVGAGVDHLQWARAGADCYGVDLTDAAIDLTRSRLELYGLHSNLQRADAETLPFPDDSFDVVYSWGVIHHSADPERIVAEINRVLKPGGTFVGMMYGRHSLKVFTAWVYWAAIRGKPWRSFRDVLWNHVESPGTKAYTVGELKRMFSSFSAFSAKPIITPYDTRVYPRWIHRFFPDNWGWFIALRATK
jgi:ubiquinone/menaquinone biosynthesis C-methylase UbiE